MLVETPYFGGVINSKTYLNHELGSKCFFLSDLAYKFLNLLFFEELNFFKKILVWDWTLPMNLKPVVSATEVPEIAQLVFNTELLAISSMSEVRSEHRVCFGASLRPTKGFLIAKKSPKECDLRPPPFLVTFGEEYLGWIRLRREQWPCNWPPQLLHPYWAHQCTALHSVLWWLLTSHYTTYCILYTINTVYTIYTIYTIYYIYCIHYGGYTNSYVWANFELSRVLWKHEYVSFRCVGIWWTIQYVHTYMGEIAEENRHNGHIFFLLCAKNTSILKY